MYNKYSRHSDKLKWRPHFILPPAGGNRSTVLGKYRPPSGSFMKSSAVTTSVDAIWRGREHCYFSIREGTRHQGSIKTIMAFRSKCWAMPGTKNKKCGNSCLKNPLCEKRIERKEWEQKLVPWWLRIIPRNIVFFMMTFNVTFIHINLLTRFISLK